MGGARRRATFKVWLQAIAIQEPGRWDLLFCLTSPPAYSDMSACVCLYAAGLIRAGQGTRDMPGSSHRTQDASLTAADRGTRTARVERERCTQEHLAASVQTFTLFARTPGGGGAGVGRRRYGSGIAVVMGEGVLVQCGAFRAL